MQTIPPDIENTAGKLRKHTFSAGIRSMMTGKWNFRLLSMMELVWFWRETKISNGETTKTRQVKSNLSGETNFHGGSSFNLGGAVFQRGCYCGVFYFSLRMRAKAELAPWLSFALESKVYTQASTYCLESDITKCKTSVLWPPPHIFAWCVIGPIFVREIVKSRFLTCDFVN